MTQNTQTTAERIRNLIFDAIQDSPYGDESIVAAPLGVTIAAEIDTLTAQRDEARADLKSQSDAALVVSQTYQASLDRVDAQLAEARTEIDALTAQLAEAKPKADAWDARDAYIREPGDDDRLYEDWESAEFNIIMAQKNAQLTEARAEVERLRPAAEAFEWWENYASNPSTTTWDIFQTAAQRARDLSFVESRAVILDDYQIDTLKRGVTRAREARAAKESQP